MRPSFIQLGDQYFATIIAGPVEDVLRDLGPFDSATRAVAAAKKRLEKPKIPLATVADRDALARAIWKTEKAAEQVALRSAADLIGVEVVRKRRRAFKRS